MKPEQEQFYDMDKHLTEDKRPSVYFENLKSNCFSQTPFSMLGRLKTTQQSPVHHPEGSVWNHTMLVIDAAAQRKESSSDSRAFMWAALLHDIGKANTTKRRKGKITSYNHDSLGAQLAREFLEHFDQQEAFIERVSALVRWHMQILFVVNSLRFSDIRAMKEQVPVDEIALLGLCDRLGRLGVDKEKEERNIQIFLEKCKTISL